MHSILVAIRDRQLNAYMLPWPAQTTGIAQRHFTDTINDPESNLYRHPEDFELYYLGDFNINTGLLSPLEGGPRQIAIGSNVKQK